MSKTSLAEELALKSFFLGPMAENAPWVKSQIDEIFSHWFDWRKHQFPFDGKCITTQNKKNPEFIHYRNNLSKELLSLLKKLEGEIPIFSPRYIGHMVSEISLPALLGHLAALLRNPNNISGEVSRVGIKLEREAIEFLVKMIGANKSSAKGHFTSGGTVANIEAVWRARYALDHWLALGTYLVKNNLAELDVWQSAHMGWEKFDRFINQHHINIEDLKEFSLVASNPHKAVKSINEVFKIDYLGPVALVPSNKHYSWLKGISLLGFGEEAFWPIDLDITGKLCLGNLHTKILKAKSENRPILMITSVLGTTELGEFDPVHKVNALVQDFREKENIHFWHHVDAAYGGFFCTLLGDEEERKLLSPDNIKALESVKYADSITLDPHKLGYVPYACGAIIVKDERHYMVSQFTAPYITGSGEGNLWLKTLEGSRPATGAAAMWLTAKSIGLNAKGYGKVLATSIETKLNLEKILKKSLKDCYLIPHCDSNVLCFCIAPNGEVLSATNKRSEYIYNEISRDQSFYVSKTSLSFSSYKKMIDQFISSWQGIIDDDHLVLIRIVIMNPFFSSQDGKINYSNALIERLQEVVS